MSTPPANFSQTSPAIPSRASNPWPILLRGLAGGALGGVVGYFLFHFLLARQFYALALPGAVVGVGSGLLARGRSEALAAICAAAAILLAIFIEWQRAPLKADGSLLYFVTHLHQLDGGTVKFVMIAVGAMCAYWFGRGR